MVVLSPDDWDSVKGQLTLGSDAAGKYEEKWMLTDSPDAMLELNGGG